MLRSRSGALAAATLALLGIALGAASAHAAIQVSVSVPRCTSSVETCPAPQAVFFDATATACTAGECSDSYRELQYTWNFGDPNSGNWPTGPSGQSKNVDSGPIAFHVWENPGSYVVSLTVTDGVNTANWSTQIFVQDPDASFPGNATHCISNTGNFNGCPANATRTTDSSADFDASLAAAFGAGARRVLFEANRTWIAGSRTNLPFNGPAQVGVYGAGGPGTGRAAISASTGSIFGLNAARHDWTFFDFDANWPNNGGHIFEGTSHTGTNFLFYRMGNDRGFTPYSWQQVHDPQPLPDDVFIVGDGQWINGLPGNSTTPCIFWSMGRAVVAGMRFGPQCERDVRWSLDSALPNDIMGPTIFAHNTSSLGPKDSPEGESILAFRGSCGNPDAGTGGHQYGLIADNVMTTPNSSHIHLRGIVCNNAPMDIADVIIERNQVRTQGIGFVQNSAGRRITVRNNVAFMSQNGGRLYRSWGQPESSNGWVGDNHVYNNSIYSPQFAQAPPIEFGAYDAGGTCRNNLFWDASGSTHRACGGVGSPTNTHNGSRSPVDIPLLTSPFAGTPTVNGPISAWSLNGNAGGGLTAVGTGFTLQYVLRDFFDNDRSGLGYDLGAIQQGASSPPPAVVVLPPVLLP